METVYNCRRYQYETGEHITFYHHAINAGKEKPEDSLLNKTHDISDRTPEAEKHAMTVSASRAKNNVYRIARSNKWDWFITLTFDRTKTDASDYDLVLYRLKIFLNNLQKRKCPDMKYIIVPELHKDKEHYHFHGLLANVDNLTFKAWKVDRKKKQIIYNITDWSYGFTTATKVLDTGRVSSYITKYITKSVDEHLKEKHRYYYSRNCHIAEEEHFLLDEEDFRKIYADRIVYVKTVDIPQAGQQITYYELKY